MDRERDEANLMGQAAGLIAVLFAVVQALPPSTRKRLPQQLNAQFDSLLAAMRATGAPDTDASVAGAEWVRDLFLKRLADDKPKGRSSSRKAQNGVDIQL